VPPLRQSHEKHKRRAGFEDLLVKGPEGSEGGWENVNPFIFCTGVVYGDGEEYLQAIFKDIWLGPERSDGSLALVAPNGRVPMVHRADVIQGVVATLGESPPGEPYMFAVDAGTDRFSNVVSVLRSELAGSFGGGPGGKLAAPPPEPEAPKAPTEAGEEGEAPQEGEGEEVPPETPAVEAPPETAKQLSAEEIERLARWEARLQEAVAEGRAEGVIALDLVLDSQPFMDFIGEDVEEEPPKWRAREGIIKNIPAVTNEYRARRGIGPMRIMLSGADVPTNSKALEALGQRLSQRYNVPYLSLDYVVKQVTDESGEFYSEEIASAMKACFDKPQERIPEPEPEPEAEEAAAGEEAPSGPAVPRPDTPISGWQPSRPVFEPSRQLYVDKRATKLKTDVETTELAYRQVLGTHVCRNQGFVLNAAVLNTAQLDRLFRDFPVEKVKAEGEEEEAEPEPDEEAENKAESAECNDGRVEGVHMPEFCIVVQGIEAIKREGVTVPEVQYVLDSAAAKTRNQKVIKVAEKPVIDPIQCNMVLEGVIQQVGRPLHYGFDSAAEGLERLDPVRIAEAAGEVEDKGESKLERQRKQKEANDLKRVGDKKEILSVAVDEELEAQRVAAEMPTRAYALEYALPALHRAMCMAGRIRPEDPVDFVANFLMHFEELKDTLPEPGKLKLPEIGAKKNKSPPPEDE